MLLAKGVRPEGDAGSESRAAGLLVAEPKEGTGAEAGRVSLWRGDWREPTRGAQDVFRPL